MSKKIILIFMVVLFFSRFNFARAEVIINEVQIKPIGESFIELYNSGASQDLTGWFIKRKTASGLEYPLISASRLKDKSIPADSYFLLTNEEGYIGNITSNVTWAKSYSFANDNTIILYNASEDSISKIGWGDVSDCSDPCPSNPPEGQSIQKTGSGSWVIATPTPGATNEVSATLASTASGSIVGGSTSSNSSNSFSTQTTTTAETKSKITEEPKIKVQIATKTLGFVDLPLSFQATAFGLSGEKLYYGKYFWNFGDGNSKEVSVTDSAQFTHTYFYPGEYVVSLDYYQNSYNLNVPDASNQITIKIIPADVSISKVGDEKDFFVELSNNTNYDVNISNWILGGGLKSFIFPKNTILGAKKKITVSPKVTGLSILDKDVLKLMNPQNEIIFDYATSITSANMPALSKANRSVKNVVSEAIAPAQVVSVDQNEQVSAENSLATSADEQASVASSDVVKNNSVFNYLPMTIFLILLGGSAVAVYFIRQRRIIPNVGDDFKILDE
ncbi:MAG: lamin tail domain-containing protein [Candidatus Nomurabacteria bacterium]|nr:lamin tail domain-containing protein [Candidatus Nomurabacteria bacterium]